MLSSVTTLNEVFDDDDATLCATDVYVVILTCFDAEDKASLSSSSTISVVVDSSISSRSRSACMTTSRYESRFVVAENMNNVTLGRLRCRDAVFCSNKHCALTVRGAPRRFYKIILCTGWSKK